MQYPENVVLSLLSSHSIFGARDERHTGVLVARAP
jgi:hypothetical protein